MDDYRKRFKKQVTANVYREFESKRLKTLDRSEDMLETLYKDIQSQSSAEMNLIDVSTNAELHRAENTYSNQLKQKLEIHETYMSEVDAISHIYEDLVDKSYNSRSLDSNGVDVLFDARIKYNENLFGKFKEVMSKIFAQEQIEDEMRNLRAQLKLELDALEGTMDFMKFQRLESLMNSQSSRRSEVKSIQEEIDTQFNSESISLAKSLADGLDHIESTRENRQEDLEHHLIESGLSEEEAKSRAKKEVETSISKEKQLLQTDFDVSKKKRDEMMKRR
jgi:hypothetical protein